MLGALPIAEWGTSAQRTAWLPKVVEGSAILTAALTEEQADPAHPTTVARKDGGGWRLTGVKICVPAGELADAVLVPATVDGKAVVFLVEATMPGLRTEPVVTTSGQPEARIELDDVRVGAEALLGTVATGAEILAWITERATTALACVALGVTEQALAMTSRVHQEPQAIRSADRDVPGGRTAPRRRLRRRRGDPSHDAGRRPGGSPPACRRRRRSRLRSTGPARAGQRVVHTAQHLHGGMGVDRDYPLHRYFLYAKQLELALGGTTTQLRTLGRLIAAEADARG